MIEHHRIFEVNSRHFDALALEVFSFQYQHVGIYRKYCDALKRTPDRVNQLSDIPFLPVEFFKTQVVLTNNKTPEIVFESSTTTGSIPSKHFLADCSLYRSSYESCFRRFFGSEEDYCMLALLPSYLERGHSSLVYMTNGLMKNSNHPSSGFFLNNFEALRDRLVALELKHQKTLLLGVTYALLDFALQFPMVLQNTIVMETGGMKGRKREMIRDEVHSVLKQQFAIDAVHSEYGMTELLSQAYAIANGVFETPPWMKVMLSNVNDPLEIVQDFGRINVIDLANLYSCSFLQTSDLGRLHSNGSFEVLGRLQGSDQRGCSLLYV